MKDDLNWDILTKKSKVKFEKEKYIVKVTLEKI